MSRTPLETLIAASLHERAEDVVATPLLWQRIDADLQRRARRRTLLLSLAGAAAVVVLALGVPRLLASDGPTRGVEVVTTPSESAPTTSGITGAAGVPGLLVTTDGQGLLLTDRAGGVIEDLTDPDRTGGDVLAPAVRPGSAGDQVTVAYVLRRSEGIYQMRVVTSQALGGFDVAVSEPLGEIGAGDAGAGGSSAAQPPAPVWSEDGTRLAWIAGSPGGEANAAASLQVTSWDPTVEGGGAGAVDTWVLGPGAPPSPTLQTPADGPPDATAWLAVGSDGRAVVLTTSSDGIATAAPMVGPGLGARTVDIAGGTVASGSVDVLAIREGSDADGGTRLVLTRDGDELPLPDEVAMAPDPAPVWMTALDGGVLVGVDGRAWIVSAPPDPADAEVTEVASIRVTYAAFVRDAAPGRVPDPLPTAASEPDAAPESPSPTSAVATGATYVTTDGPSLYLTDPATGASSLLYDLPSTVASSIRDVAVRPGSTPDDLTVVYLVAGEGGYDLRYLIRRNGEVVTNEVFAPQYNASPGVSSLTRGRAQPVWASDGSALAWTEPSADGPATLRIIGWAEGPGTGDTATDNTSFELGMGDGPFATGELTLEDFVIGDGPGRMSFIAPPETGASARSLAFEIQPDGAFALTDGDTPSAAPPDEATATYDIATTLTDDSGAIVRTYRLVGLPGQIALRVGPEEILLPLSDDTALPDAIARAAEPDRIWLTAGRDGLYLGIDFGGWHLALDGTITSLGGGVPVVVDASPLG